jgi:hypothetical protein
MPAHQAVPDDGPRRQTALSLEYAPVELLVHGEQEDHRHIHPHCGQNKVCDYAAVASGAGRLGFVGAHDGSILDRFPLSRKSREALVRAGSESYPVTGAASSPTGSNTRIGTMAHGNPCRNSRRWSANAV